MKSLMQLLRYVLADASDGCCTSTTRDFNYVSRRVEHEGLSFLTITLPAFAQDFERCLELGTVAHATFLGYKKRGFLPEFLRGLTELVFNSTTGGLLPEPDVNAIFFVEQISLLFKKLLVPCSDARTQKAFRSYKEIDDEVTRNTLCVSGQSESVPSHHFGDFGHVSDVLWSASLCAASLAVHDLLHIPRHGPGATAERISGNAKFDIQTWHARLEQYFPADLFAVPTVDRLMEGLIDFVEPGEELPVRVISVPKTLKTPRIIAIEPVCMQYTQQSVSEILVTALEQHPLTSGSVNFTDQRINQDEALASSRTGKFATLDLSEASDRVSNQLVIRMLKTLPDLLGAVQACRSTKADVPGQGIIPLSKFASMGSALCFPIESMVFYTIAISAIARAKSIRLTQRSLRGLKSQVRVYGDDIIVPVDVVLPVIEALEALGLKVNRHKSFWISKFRESCGVRAFNGYRITPVFVRRLLSSDRRDGSVVAWVELSNNLYKTGLWKTAHYVRVEVEKILGSLPFVCDNTPALGWKTFKQNATIGRWNTALHRFETWAPVFKVTPKASRASGYGALMKFFLKRGDEPFQDEKHLERLGRSGIANIKFRWVPAQL